MTLFQTKNICPIPYDFISDKIICPIHYDFILDKIVQTNQARLNFLDQSGQTNIVETNKIKLKLLRLIRSN